MLPMLWLAVLLPALPLQLAERVTEPGHAVAIVEGPAQRPLIVHCNDAARDQGVAPGMKLAAAQALVRDLIAVERHLEHEREALAELAAWAYQFSGEIVAQADGVLIETGGSERLFGGRSRLSRAVRDGLMQLGYRAAFGYAVTPRAARVVALARARRLACPHLFDAAHLEAALAPLPFTLIEWSDATTDTLHALGLATIGDLLALPRPSFAKRFGRERLDDLDRLLARRADPQPMYAPPERFAATIELPADVTDTARLMLPAQRLLASLEGFLRGRGAGTTALQFTATHDARRTKPQPPTEITLKLAAPERDAGRLGALLAERLTRVTLPEPAIALALAVEQLQPFATMNGSLLPQPAEPGVDWLKLAETLHARLGSERVFQLQAVDDHRPEHAWRAVPLAIDGAGAGAVPLPPSPRPLLLLPLPQPLPLRNDQPLYRDPLTLVTGPERIECGWWDLGRPGVQAVHRDYFVARNGRGQLLWIFRELAAPRGWFLHGLFA
ncbi:MAG: DNA polymerase Y family protein [Burkholderiaceae bacterium]